MMVVLFVALAASVTVGDGTKCIGCDNTSNTINDTAVINTAPLVSALDPLFIIQFRNVVSIEPISH